MNRPIAHRSMLFPHFGFKTEVPMGSRGTIPHLETFAKDLLLVLHCWTVPHQPKLSKLLSRSTWLGSALRRSRHTECQGAVLAALSDSSGGSVLCTHVPWDDTVPMGLVATFRCGRHHLWQTRPACLVSWLSACEAHGAHHQGSCSIL